MRTLACASYAGWPIGSFICVASRAGEGAEREPASRFALPERIGRNEDRPAREAMRSIGRLVELAQLALSFAHKLEEVFRVLNCFLFGSDLKDGKAPDDFS